MTEAQKKNGFLIGCFVIFIIAVVCFVSAALILWFKGEAIMNSALDQAKDGIGYFLTEDHSESERSVFLSAFEDFIDEIKVEGWREGIESNINAIDVLQEIIRDKRINKSESTQWVQAYLNRDIMPEEEVAN